ncbi:hypothetical protein KRMM14A1004_61250 [Krasilnikovia sp. MM14-A1004]
MSSAKAAQAAAPQTSAGTITHKPYLRNRLQRPTGIPEAYRQSLEGYAKIMEFGGQGNSSTTGRTADDHYAVPGLDGSVRLGIRLR